VFLFPRLGQIHCLKRVVIKPLKSFVGPFPCPQAAAVHTFHTLLHNPNFQMYIWGKTTSNNGLGTLNAKNEEKKILLGE